MFWDPVYECNGSIGILKKSEHKSVTQFGEKKKKRYKSFHWGGTFLKGTYRDPLGTKVHLLKRCHHSHSFCTFFFQKCTLKYLQLDNSIYDGLHIKSQIIIKCQVP